MPHTVFKTMEALRRKLDEAKSDKEAVKILLKAVEEYNTSDDKFERLGAISFAIGYLGSLLAKHKLYDFKEDNNGKPM